MFVEAHCAVPLSLARARAALDRALADGGLVAESSRAYEDGICYYMRVGPRGAGGLSKEVRVLVLPSRQVGENVVVPLRWEATGQTGRLCPSFDANLSLTSGAAATTLSIVGRYDPPLGLVGRGLDRALLSRGAQMTADSLLAEIKTRLQQLDDSPTV